MEMPLIARAIGTAARAGGMAGVAREAGLSREDLYRSLNNLTGDDGRTNDSDEASFSRTMEGRGMTAAGNTYAISHVH
jgi:hypothetical protein